MDDVERVSAVFRKFDLNEDGLIDSQELGQVMQTLDPSLPPVEKLMRAMFFRHGKVSYDAFIDWALAGGELQNAFFAAAEDGARDPPPGFRKDPRCLDITVVLDVLDSWKDFTARRREKVASDVRPTAEGQQGSKWYGLRAFQLYDYDGTGLISFVNLKRICVELGEALTDAEIMEMIDVADRGGGGALGGVEQADFLWLLKDMDVINCDEEDTRSSRDMSSLTRGGTATVGRVREVFERFDEDDDGILSKEEIVALLSHLASAGSCGFTRAEVEQIMYAVDENHDGYLQVDEFISWVDGPVEGAPDVKELVQSPRAGLLHADAAGEICFNFRIGNNSIPVVMNAGKRRRASRYTLGTAGHRFTIFLEEVSDDVKRDHVGEWAEYVQNVVFVLTPTFDKDFVGTSYPFVCHRKSEDVFDVHVIVRWKPFVRAPAFSCTHGITVGYSEQFFEVKIPKPSVGVSRPATPHRQKTRHGVAYVHSRMGWHPTSEDDTQQRSALQASGVAAVSLV